MRVPLFLALASLVLYHVAVLAFAPRGSLPSFVSYRDGLVAAVGPFAVLALVIWVGVPATLASALKGLAVLISVVAVGATATGQGHFFVPALLILFGTCTTLVLFFALLSRFVRWAVSRARRT